MTQKKLATGVVLILLIFLVRNAALAATPTPNTANCPWDIVKTPESTNGKVDSEDLAKLNSCYDPLGFPNAYCQAADLSQDNIVNALDYSILLTHWGDCPRLPTITIASIDFYGNRVSFLRMFGQAAYGEVSEDTVVNNRVMHAAGIVIDKSVKPNRIYIIDTGNNRILGFRNLGVCQNDSGKQCTNDSDCPSGTCRLNYDRAADLIFGQTNEHLATCNGDSNLGVFKNASASQICLIGFPKVTNTGEYWLRVNIDVDSEGNLYIPDLWNNRILKYRQPFSDDKSNGKGDTVADFIIGQDNFEANGINKGLGPNSRNDSSLFINSGNDYGFDNISTRGVSVDPQKNVWVADTFNGRILRFPPGSKRADLVLGKPNFSSGTSSYYWEWCNTDPNYDKTQPGRRPLDKMCLPTLARINPETGELFVIDESARGFQARILVFKPPFINGMTAYKIIIPRQTLPLSNDSWTYWFQATGLSFNNYKVGDYASGVIWVSEHSVNRVILLDMDGNIIKSIGTPNNQTRGCDYGLYGRCNQDVFSNFNLCWPGSSPAFDDAGNIFLGDESYSRYSRFSLPYNTWSNGTEQCLPEAAGGIFDTKSGNAITGYKTKGSVGAITFQNQLIVKDHGRYLVWNDYLNKDLGSKSDFVVGKPNEFTREGGEPLGARGIHTIDDANRLWITNGHGRISLYQLPLRSDSKMLADSLDLYWNDDRNTKVEYGVFESGMAFDKINNKLWVVDGSRHRLLRVSNYSEYNNKLYVDLVLGQRNKSEVMCNHNQASGWHAGGNPTADSLCNPYSAKFDQFGNLYVVENAYECHGNDRIVVFMAQDLAAATDLFPNLAAKKVFVSSSLTQGWTCSQGRTNEPFSPVNVAFNSQNNMVVGNDGYYANTTERAWRQLWFYRDPLKKNPDGSFVQGQKPDAAVNLPLGAVGELNFDRDDNLIVQDHTWPKVWLINFERDSSWLIPVNQ